MANSATLATLRTRVAANVDRTFSTTTFVTTAQASQWINDGLSKIHYLMADSGEDYIAGVPATYTLVPGTASYDLPTDFYKVRGVDIVSGGQTFDVHRFMAAERNRRQDENAAGPGYQYRLVGQTITLIPTPGTGELCVNYVPQFSVVTANLHEAVPEGWEDYAVNHASAMCLLKSQEDASFYLGQCAEQWANMKKFCEPRDQLEPLRVVDKSRRWDRGRWAE